MSKKELLGIKAYSEYDTWLYSRRDIANCDCVAAMKHFARKNSIEVRDMISMKDHVKPRERDAIIRRNPNIRQQLYN
jgi:hypothetical protein